MIGSAETISTHYLCRYICHKRTAKQSFFFIWEKLRARQYHRLFGAYLADEKQWRSVYALLLFSLALAFVNAFSTEEHVKRFFRPEHRALLPETTSLEFQDEPALLTSSQWLAHCEPSCEKLDVPAYLTASNQKQTSYFKEIHETNCSLGYFNRLHRGF